MPQRNELSIILHLFRHGEPRLAKCLHLDEIRLQFLLALGHSNALAAPACEPGAAKELGKNIKTDGKVWEHTVDGRNPAPVDR